MAGEESTKGKWGAGRAEMSKKDHGEVLCARQEFVTDNGAMIA